MAVNLNLTKEQILKKYNSPVEDWDFPTLDEMDTLAHYNEEYLKNNGWEQRQGIGFYFNDKYTTNRYTYWIDCNAISFSAYRSDRLTKENVEIGNYDRRIDNNLSFYDVEDFVNWLDGAIGHEKEYCLYCIEKKKDELNEAIPEKYNNCVIWFYNNGRNKQDKNIPEELLAIQQEWSKLSEAEGDSGGCVLGHGMQFLYHDQWYMMNPTSPWQGEGSWTPFVNQIKEKLTDIGATNIIWHCGRLD